MREIGLLDNLYHLNNIDELFKLKISENAHFLYRIVDELKKEKSKTIIWGTYANALKCSIYLKKEFNISIDACVVNKKYMDLSINQVTDCSGLPFESLEDFLNQNENINIIIDFSFYDRNLIREYEQKIKNIFIADIMGTFVFDYPYIINKDMLKRERNKIQYASNFLADDISRKEYLEFISQKIWGFYNKYYHKNQYFDKAIMTLTDEEVYVDCGAYDGDSIRAFKNNVNDYKQIYAIEMDKNNFKKLLEYEGNNDKCIFIQKALGEKTTKMKAYIGKNSSSHLDELGEEEVEIETLDNLIKEKVTMIKMDIEGYELEALEGARRIITSYSPKLAICMYHKFKDLWEIPLLIKEMNPDYKLYFRNYHNSASESILYALV